MVSPEVSVRWPMAPRSLIVRMPILIPFPLIAAPLPPLRRATAAPEEPALDALQPLPLQGGEPHEVRALLELHDPAEARLEGGDRVVDVAAVQRVARLEPQRVAGAQAARRAATGTHERVPQPLQVRAAAVQLDAVLARVAGAGEEALDSRHLARGEA